MRASLPGDYTRCLAGAWEERCPRAERCARHLALQTDAAGSAIYHSMATRLCYSGFTFFIDAEGLYHE